MVRNPVLNGSLGAEYVIAGRFPLRAGLFTDLATSPQANALDDLDNSSHIDRFGGTASIGLRTEHTATDIGVQVVGGSGEDVIPNNLDFTSLEVSGSSQLSYYLFLGTAYQF